MSRLRLSTRNAGLRSFAGIVVASALLFSGVGGAVAAEPADMTATPNTSTEVAASEPLSEDSAMAVDQTPEVETAPETPASVTEAEPAPLLEPEPAATAEPSPDEEAAGADSESSETKKTPPPLQGSESKQTEASPKAKAASRTTKESPVFPLSQGPSGTMSWSIRDSFLTYLNMSFTGGKFATSEGLTRTTTGFDWQISPSDSNLKDGMIAFDGKVRFTAHDGAMDLTFSDPQIQFLCGDRAQISVLTTSKPYQGSRAISNERLAFGEVSLNSPVTGESELAFTSGAGVLGQGGSDAFASFYQLGEEFSPFTLDLVGMADLETPEGACTDDGDDEKPGEGSVTPPNGNGGGSNDGSGSNNGGNSGDGSSENPVQTDTRSGSLTWGVKESFRKYLATPLAHGRVALSGAVKNASGNAYVFPQTSHSFDGKKGTVKYSGSVQFTGHDGLLDTKFVDPYVVIDGSKGQLWATVSALDMEDKSKNFSNVKLKIADLSLGNVAANKDGSFTFKTSKVSLSADGVRAFSSFYAKGVELDPATIVIGASDWTAAGAKGSTAGMKFDIAKKTVRAGQKVKVSASGFNKNQKGIRLYIYSTPVELARDLSANGSGTVSATVRIPASIEAGSHTLSFETATQRAQQKIVVSASNAGSDNDEDGATGNDGDADVAGTDETNTVKEDPKEEDKCIARAVSGASLSWGVKGTYVTYVTGGIAKGEIVTSGVSQNGKIFNWSGGSGKYNTAAGMGSISFPGSIQFKGHAGAMDTKLSNIRVQISGNKGYLYANVNAKGYTNDGIVKNGALIGTINLAGAKSVFGNTLNISGASVTLAAEGAEAFGGFYEAGSAIDPISLTAQLGANVDCDTGSGSGLANTGADNVQTGTAAAIFFVLAGAVALVASRRKMAVKA